LGQEEEEGQVRDWSKWILSWAAVAGWRLTAILLVPTYIITKSQSTALSLKLAFWYFFNYLLLILPVCAFVNTVNSGPV